MKKQEFKKIIIKYNEKSNYGISMIRKCNHSKKTLKNVFVFFILLISFIFINSFSFANTTVPDSFYTDAQAWLNEQMQKNKGEVWVYNVEENGTSTKMPVAIMPGNSDKFTYESSSGMYVYKVKENGQTVDTIRFNVDAIFSNGGDSTLTFGEDGVNSGNYSNYSQSVQGSTIMELTDDGKYVKQLQGSTDSLGEMAYVIDIDGNLINSDAKKTEVTNPPTDFGDLFEYVVDFGGKALEMASSVLGGVVNDFLLTVADGIQGLIDGIFGSSNLSLYNVIFGKVEKLNINFWRASATTAPGEGEEAEEPSGIVDNSPSSALKNVVNYWYSKLKAIAIAFYLVLLLYIGVRILLSTTTAVQKYKELLSSWLLGVIILGFYPYVMMYTVELNNSLVGMIGGGAYNTSTSTTTGTETSGNTTVKPSTNDIMITVRNDAEANNNVIMTVVYIIMLGQLIVLLVAYYKRVFMMAFLITIFPIVAVLFLWERSNGRSKVLSTWTREYVVLVFTQTFHAVVYVITIETSYQAYLNNNNWLFFLISVMFLFEAEKIIRAIFGMKSSANTIGDLAKTGATLWAASTAFGGMFKRDGGRATKDEQDLSVASKQVAQNKKNTTINQTMRNIMAGQRYTAISNATRVTNASDNTANSNNNSNGYVGGSGNSGTTPTASNDTHVTNGKATNQKKDAINNVVYGNTSGDINVGAAQALITQGVLNSKTKRGLISKAVGATTRAAGITLGLTSGLANGSLQEGIKNAAIFNAFGGIAAKGINSITGYAKGAFAGQIMSVKIKSGLMDEKLKEAGFDFGTSFDEDAKISDKKAEAIRNALAAEASAMGRGGKEKGELKYIETIEKERRRLKL